MWRVVLLLSAAPALADSVVATRSTAQGAVITMEDVTTVAMEIPGAVAHLKDVIGQTTANGLVAGRAVLAQDIQQQLRIQRNTIVALTLRSGGMEIRTEGRALSEGGVGDVIDIMNLSSRTRIKGLIENDGTILVTSGQSTE